MQINGVSSYLNHDLNNFNAARPPVPRDAQEPPRIKNDHTPGVVVNISQQALDYQSKKKADEGLKEIAAAEEIEGCQSCKNRKYVDESNDPSVSFQTPQPIDSSQSFSRVRAHEYEHVSNEQAKAHRDDRKVVSQTVTLSMSICPECGSAYISGGMTRTVTKDDNKPQLQGEMPVVENDE
ncbi:MAG: hypothetical protein FWB83_10585 [Treponema sp.]|nr:hypothetical protein [Treponema sp.]